jgi:hypothetical protein
MECVVCGSAAASERNECTARGYRRFRCRACGKQFNKQRAGSLNRYPGDVIALVVLWRLRYGIVKRPENTSFFIDPAILTGTSADRTRDSAERAGEGVRATLQDRQRS